MDAAAGSGTTPTPDPIGPPWWRRLLRPAAMLAVAGVLLWGLGRVLGTFDHDQVIAGLRAVPIAAIAGAVALLALQHALFIVREALAVRFAGVDDLALWRVAIASLIARSLSSLGLATITGYALRLRIYEAWGLSPRTVTTLSLYNEATYYVGIAVSIAAVFLVADPPPLSGLHVTLPSHALIGGVAAAVVALYVVVSLRRDQPLQLRSFTLPVVRGPLLAGQLVLPIVDIFVGSAIVWIVLPDAAGLSLTQTTAACLLAGVVGSISQVPGGLGVFETVVLQFVPPAAHPATLAALLVRRVIVMLLPIGLGALLLVGFEAGRRPAPALPTWRLELAATATAVVTFAAGVLLMVAASVPEAGSPLRALGPVAHTLVFAVGVGTLLIARGLHLRHDGAWRMAVALFAARAALAVISGPDVTALVLALGTIVLLIASRRACTGPEATRDDDAAWFAAFAIAIAGVGWLSLIADPDELGRAAAARAAGAITAIAVITAAAIDRRRRAAARERGPGSSREHD